MIEKILVDSDKVLSKLGLETVVVYSNDSNNCCLSCHTSDDLAYVFIKSNDEGYVEKEFALRNWDSVHSVLSSLYSQNNPESFNVTINYDTENYPNMFRIKSGRLKMNYYLQNYSFIRNKQELMDNYTKKKFQLNSFTDEGHNIEPEIVKEVSNLSGLINEKYFRILSDDFGTYIVFGDENQSCDNASIKISDEVLFSTMPDRYFPVSYFVSVYNSLNINDENVSFKIKLMSDKIIMVSENIITKKIVIIRGKKI